MTATVKTRETSQTWTYFEDAWHEGNVAIMGPRTHGAWLGSTVFDGGRHFEGVSPDLDRHLERINRSARFFNLKPVVEPGRWLDLAREGIERFPKDAAIYVRPMYWADAGAAGGGVRFDPESTRWCLCLYAAPMPVPKGLSITFSPYRKPTAETAPVEAKAGCLYPNNGRALIEAFGRGFDNCLMRDALGHVAELANSNVMLAKDGVVYTPAPNGTFLNGVTRQRLIGLLRDAGVTVVETVLDDRAFREADEIFSCGNFSKVMPVTRIDDRSLQPGPLYTKARKLYWDFAHG